MNLPSVSISLFHNTFQINRSIYYVVYCIHFFPLNLTLLRFIHDTDFIKYFPSEPHSLKTETVLEVPASKVPPNMPSLTSRVRAKMFGELFDRKNWSVPTSCLAHVRPWVPLLAHQDGLRELETLPLIDNYREKSWKAEEPGSGWAPHWVKAVSHGTVANCQWTKERGTQVNKPPSRWDVASKCKSLLWRAHCPTAQTKWLSLVLYAHCNKAGQTTVCTAQSPVESDGCGHVRWRSPFKSGQPKLGNGGACL